MNIRNLTGRLFFGAFVICALVAHAQDLPPTFTQAASDNLNGNHLPDAATAGLTAFDETVQKQILADMTKDLVVGLDKPLSMRTKLTMFGWNGTTATTSYTGGLAGTGYQMIGDTITYPLVGGDGFTPAYRDLMLYDAAKGVVVTFVCVATVTGGWSVIATLAVGTALGSGVDVAYTCVTGKSSTDQYQNSLDNNTRKSNYPTSNDLEDRLDQLYYQVENTDRKLFNNGYNMNADDPNAGVDMLSSAVRQHQMDLLEQMQQLLKQQAVLGRQMRLKRYGGNVSNSLNKAPNNPKIPNNMPTVSVPTAPPHSTAPVSMPNTSGSGPRTVVTAEYNHAGQFLGTETFYTDGIHQETVTVRDPSGKIVGSGTGANFEIGTNDIDFSKEKIISDTKSPSAATSSSNPPTGNSASGTSPAKSSVNNTGTKSSTTAGSGTSAAAQNSANNTAKNGAQNSAKNGAQNSAKNGAQNSAKNGAQNSAKNAAQNSAKNAAQNATKSAAQNSAKNAAQNSAKNAAQNAAKNVAQTTAKNAAKNAAQAGIPH